MKGQTGATEPLRDWFPLSAIGPLVDVTDLLKGAEADWGTMKCGCHPNCGIGTAFMVSKKTKKWKPVTEFIDVERFIADARDDRRHGALVEADQGADGAQPAAQLPPVAARPRASRSSTC